MSLRIAFLDGPWTAEAVAERGARLSRPFGRAGWGPLGDACRGRLPRAADRSTETSWSASSRGFLAGRSSPTGDSELPLILRRLVSVRPRLAQPLGRSPRSNSVGALADRLEPQSRAARLAGGCSAPWSGRWTGEKLRKLSATRAVQRRSGLPRVIEAPKARLKGDPAMGVGARSSITSLHTRGAQGFTPRSLGRHPRPASHTGQDAVWRLDLRDFFASIAARPASTASSARSATAPAVAHVLTGLTHQHGPAGRLARDPEGHRTEPGCRRSFWLGRQLATPHLPQGAPTSPALANLAAFRLDRRLTGLGRPCGDWATPDTPTT